MFREMFETVTSSEIEDLKKEFNTWVMIDTEENELLIQADGMDIKAYKLPKKITKEWIKKKIISYYENKSSYKNLSKVFNKLIKGNVEFYATSYGIGTSIALDSEDKIKRKLKPVFDILDKNDIKYRLEYSRGFWVYKIILSRSKENLEKIKNIK